MRMSPRRKIWIADTLADLAMMTNRTMGALREIADPPAFNIGANIGAAAGAGIAAHFHFHIVPRWNGDHSFMECIGGTRTVPDTLSNLAEQIRAAWEDLYGHGARPRRMIRQSIRPKTRLNGLGRRGPNGALGFA